MQEPNLLRVFVSPLNKLNLPYMITGAVASIIYGEPRLTHDVDLVVEMTEEDTRNLVEAFPLDEFYCPPVDVIRLEIRRSLRGHFNLIHHETGFKADIYISGEDELHRWALAKRRRIKIEEETIWVAPPEYVILRKLEYYQEGRSEKHLRDIAGILEVSEEQVDLKELEGKIGEFALEEEWEKAKALVTK